MQQSHFYTSSIGRKIVMAGTGILLMVFLVVHLGLNATILIGDQGVLFDRVARFLHHNWGLRLLEILLFSGFMLHIWQGIFLTWQNRSKRTVSYEVRALSWSPARWMGMLGAVILLFLLLHLYQFWLPNLLGLIPESESLYGLMQNTLSQGWVVVVYLLGCLAVAAHLFHGWRSAAITLGLTNSTAKIISGMGIGLSIGVPLGLAAIPIVLFIGSHARF
jgi:succinate dehydrogenase / fumarate reductase, cytochrome b subunit